MEWVDLCETSRFAAKSLIKVVLFTDVFYLLLVPFYFFQILLYKHINTYNQEKYK